MTEPNAASVPTSALSADRPISSKDEDRFNGWQFAKRVAETLARRDEPDSLVIAINGVWGDGKTSTLRLIEQELALHQSVIHVKFNPWFFSSVDQLLQGFFATLADALDKSVNTTAERVGASLKKYGRLLSIASLTIGGVVQLNPGEAAEGLASAISNIDLDTLRQRIEALLRAEGKHIVVALDDIDRLDRAELLALFKMVRLSADFPHVSYVLAFDSEVVAQAIGEAYGPGRADDGRRFIEKIVQVPLSLPPADALALRSLVFEGSTVRFNLPA